MPRVHIAHVHLCTFRPTDSDDGVLHGNGQGLKTSYPGRNASQPCLLVKIGPGAEPG